MPTATLDHVRPDGDPLDVTDLTDLPDLPVPSSSSPRRTLAVIVMVAGLVAVLVAATTLLRLPGGTNGVDQPAAAPVPAAANPSAITLSARDVSVVTQVYEPGQDSGWHAHPGIHAVAVISGTLTVYDGQCQAQTFEPGRPYVGGQELHLARNETAAPVVMTVTYLNPSAPTNSTQHAAGPAGCQPSRS